MSHDCAQTARLSLPKPLNNQHFGDHAGDYCKENAKTGGGCGARLVVDYVRDKPRLILLRENATTSGGCGARLVVDYVRDKPRLILLRENATTGEELRGTAG